MSFKATIGAALAALLLGTAVYAADQSNPTPSATTALSTSPASPPANTSPATVSTSSTLTFAKFCGEAQLANNARADCQKRMGAAKNDAERAKIENSFAMGKIEAEESTGTAPSTATSK